MFSRCPFPLLRFSNQKLQVNFFLAVRLLSDSWWRSCRYLFVGSYFLSRQEGFSRWWNRIDFTLTCCPNGKIETSTNSQNEPWAAAGGELRTRVFVVRLWQTRSHGGRFWSVSSDLWLRVSHGEQLSRSSESWRIETLFSVQRSVSFLSLAVLLCASPEQ